MAQPPGINAFRFYIKSKSSRPSRPESTHLDFYIKKILQPPGLPQRLDALIPPWLEAITAAPWARD